MILGKIFGSTPIDVSCIYNKNINNEPELIFINLNTYESIKLPLFEQSMNGISKSSDFRYNGIYIPYLNYNTENKHMAEDEIKYENRKMADNTMKNTIEAIFDGILGPFWILNQCKSYIEAKNKSLNDRGDMRYANMYEYADKTYKEFLKLGLTNSELEDIKKAKVKKPDTI